MTNYIDSNTRKPDIKKLIKAARDNVNHHQELVLWAEEYLADARRQLDEAEAYLNQVIDRQPPSVILRRSMDTWRDTPLTIIEAINGYDNDRLILEPRQVKELRDLLNQWNEDSPSSDGSDQSTQSE